MYVKLNNGIVEKYPYTIGDLRKDHSNVSFPKKLEPEVLVDYEVFPVVSTERPETDLRHEVVEANPQLVTGVWQQQWEIVALPTAEADAREQAAVDAKLREVDQLRDSKLFVDLPYTFPGDSIVDAIQLRDARDVGNLQGESTDALYKLMSNDETPCYFIAKSNVTKTLTPQQMVDMGRFAKNHVQRHHLAANNHKNAIRGKSFSEVMAYDITTGWDV